MRRVPHTDDTTPALVALLRDVRTAWLDEPAAAVERLDRALQQEASWEPSERARLEARRGQLRIFLGRLTSAIVDLQEAMLSGDDPYLALQLASALRWRGGAGDWDESERLAHAARSAATRTRSGPLAIAAECVRGEIALERSRPDEAVRAYGAALGISEFASSEAVTVAPLAGLAVAHLRGRAPRKAEPLARRALERAERAGDDAGRARALMALAEAGRDRAAWTEATAVADRAPHRPLALAARVARAELDGAVPDELRASVQQTGMRRLAVRLERIGSSTG